MSNLTEWASYDDCLRKAATETFELMCFSASEEVSGAQLQSGAVIAGKIYFGGDASGRLLLAMSSETARLLAANFYGEDEVSLQDSQVEELVGELTNVVCGGMLSLLAPGGSFTLSTPELDVSGTAPAGSLERIYRLEAGDVFVSVARGLS